tara:strand:+ start:446 stop:1450 length:1005 start_codon:yes stop_codon:yes gene_type:complete
VYTRKALVTGCCGFIGGHLTKMLVEQGWDVTGVDDLSNGDPSVLDEINIRCIPPALLGAYGTQGADSSKTLVITGDFAHEYVLMKVAEGEFDVIFHLAANPRVEYSVKNPASTTHTNVQKTIELMTVATGKIDRFVFASSSAVYGNTTQLPTRESQSAMPQSPYALQKLVVEQFGQLFNNLYEMDFVALRFFNVYGPGQLGSSPYSTAIAAWCDKLKNGEPLRCDGDGEQSRDMVYVEDVATAMIACANHEKQFGFETYNVATEINLTNNEILAGLREYFPKMEVNSAPERKGDVKHTLADVYKIANDVGFAASVEFWDGLRSTLKWWGLLDDE